MTHVLMRLLTSFIIYFYNKYLYVSYVDISCLPLKIRYKFKDDSQFFSCIITYSQYINFRNLSVIDKCEISNKNEILQPNLEGEMEDALYMACKNELNPIKRLSFPEKYI